MLGDRLERTLKNRIRGELLGAGKKPRIDFSVDSPQLRLKPRRIPFRIIHQEARIDTEESCQQLARRVRQMGPGAILDLREIRLAEAAPNLILHRGGQFLLRHRTAQAAQRAFYSAKGAEFVAKFHREPLLQSANIILRIAILSSKIGYPSMCPYIAEFKWVI